MKRVNKFNDRPFAYHQEIELEITTLTNRGVGLGRVILATEPPATEMTEGGLARRSSEPSVRGWVVMVPFTLPGERIRAKVFPRNRIRISPKPTWSPC